MPEGTQKNFEQNMQDALSVLPKLKTGLDVNVKFTGYSFYDFEICSSRKAIFYKILNYFVFPSVGDDRMCHI